MREVRGKSYNVAQRLRDRGKYDPLVLMYTYKYGHETPALHDAMSQGLLYDRQSRAHVWDSKWKQVGTVQVNVAYSCFVTIMCTLRCGCIVEACKLCYYTLSRRFVSVTVN